MSETHTIVVHFPDGIVPRYSAATEFQGGQVVAVNFGGDQLEVVESLCEALEQAKQELEEIALFDGGEPYNNLQINAALAKARGES